MILHIYYSLILTLLSNCSPPSSLLPISSIPLSILPLPIIPDLLSDPGVETSLNVCRLAEIFEKFLGYVHRDGTITAPSPPTHLTLYTYEVREEGEEGRGERVREGKEGRERGEGEERGG